MELYGFAQTKKKEKFKGCMKTKKGKIIIISEHSCRPDVAVCDVNKQFKIAKKSERKVLCIHHLKFSMKKWHLYLINVITM